MKQKELKNPQRLIDYWLVQWQLIAVSFFFGILYNFGSLAAPYFNTVLINYIEAKERFASVAGIVAIFIVISLVVEFSRAVKRYTVRVFANRTLYLMRYNLYNSMLHLPQKELERINMGDLLSRNISDVNKTVEGMRKLTTEIYDTILLFFFYIGYMMIFDPIATLYSLIPIIISISLSFFLRKPLANLSVESRKQFVEVTDQTYDCFNNALLYRIYSRQKPLNERYDRTLGAYEKKNRSFLLLADSISPVGKIISLFGLIPVVYFGMIHILSQDPLLVSLPLMGDETWNAGVLSGFIMTFILMATKASNTFHLFTSMEKGMASWRKIKEQIHNPTAFSKPQSLDGDELSFDRFTLKVGDRTLMEPFSFFCRQGEAIGITGPIGSGKTAFGKVFLRQLDYEGNINLFGKELRECSEEEIIGNISYMGHQLNLLTMSIKENIAYGETKDVIPYLTAVDFIKDMQTMEEKENTIIGNEGVRLSGGQQQRIALARTLYHRRKLIILDDPFSSVDVATEKRIIQAMEAWKKDSIVILISHRLKVFPDLDRIIVLHDNGEVNIGRHEELLNQDSEYQQLFQLQNVEIK